MIKALEQSNKDLQNELTQALQGVGSESFTQNIAAQTQLVSRLNARVMNLKEREDQGLKKISELEETIKELQRLLEDDKRKGGKNPRKNLKTQQTQTETINNSKEKDSLWEDFEKHRYERKVADTSKEIVLYQNKYYEVLKNNHQIKADFGIVEVTHMEEISKLQRENINLGKEIEILQDIKYSNEADIKGFINNVDILNQKMKSLNKELENSENNYKVLTDEYEKLRNKAKQVRINITETRDEKMCKNCKRFFKDNENFNWSCKVHSSQYSGDI